MHQWLKHVYAWWKKSRSVQPGSPHHSLSSLQLRQVPVHTQPPLLRVQYPSQSQRLYPEKTWALLQEDGVTIGERSCRHPFSVSSLVHLEPHSIRSIQAAAEGLALLGGSFLHTPLTGIQPVHRSAIYSVIGEEPLTYPASDVYHFISTRHFASKQDILHRFISISVISSAVRLSPTEERLYRSVKERELSMLLDHLVNTGVLSVSSTPLIQQLSFTHWQSVISTPDDDVAAYELSLYDQTCSFSSVMHAVETLRGASGKPVGIRVKAQDTSWQKRLSSFLDTSTSVPDFVTVEEQHGNDLFHALSFYDEVFTEANLRSSLVLIANGSLDSAEKQGTALACGADLLSLRGHTLTHRKQTADRVVEMRHDLFTLASQYELASPVFFTREQVGN